MNHEEALKVMSRYNRFNVQMEMLQETLGGEYKTLGELADGMKSLQLDYAKAVDLLNEKIQKANQNERPKEAKKSTLKTVKTQ